MRISLHPGCNNSLAHLLASLMHQNYVYLEIRATPAIGRQRNFPPSQRSVHALLRPLFASTNLWHHPIPRSTSEQHKKSSPCSTSCPSAGTHAPPGSTRAAGRCSPSCLVGRSQATLRHRGPSVSTAYAIIRKHPSRALEASEGNQRKRKTHPGAASGARRQRIASWGLPRGRCARLPGPPPLFLGPPDACPRGERESRQCSVPSSPEVAVRENGRLCGKRNESDVA